MKPGTDLTCRIYMLVDDTLVMVFFYLFHENRAWSFHYRGLDIPGILHAILYKGDDF